jgi:hypothetical protein
MYQLNLFKPAYLLHRFDILKYEIDEVSVNLKSSMIRGFSMVSPVNSFCQENVEP